MVPAPADAIPPATHRPTAGLRRSQAPASLPAPKSALGASLGPVRGQGPVLPRDGHGCAGRPPTRPPAGLTGKAPASAGRLGARAWDAEPPALPARRSAHSLRPAADAPQPASPAQPGEALPDDEPPAGRNPQTRPRPT